MILVTGATGYVGARVVARALAERLPIRALARSSVAIPGADVAVADLTQPATLEPALQGVGTVVHTAALTANLKEPYPDAYDLVNRRGTENLVAAALGAGVRRIVLLSGLGTVPAPAGTYMATRWGMEEAVRRSGIEYVILQPSVLFGGRSEFIGSLARMIRRTPVVPVIEPPRIDLQPLWVEDLVTCLLASVGGGAPVGSEVPLGGPDRHSFHELTRIICEAMGKRRLLVPLPLPLARLQARVMTALLPHPPLTLAATELFSQDNATDEDAVERAFHFRPRAFRAHLMERGVEG